MSKNILQIYNTNPLNGVIPSTALTHFGLSPFILTSDAASTFGNIVTNVINNFSSIPPSSYSTGTISQSGNTITGSGTTFTSSMNNGWIIPSTGTPSRIIFVNSTSLTSTVSQTISSGTTYTLYFFPTSIFDTTEPSSISIFPSPKILNLGSSGNFLNVQSNLITQGAFSSGSINGNFYTSSQFASQSGSQITGTGTSFTPNLIGKVIFYSTGQSDLIIGYQSSTILNTQGSQSVPTTSFVISSNDFSSDGNGNTSSNISYLKTICFPLYENPNFSLFSLSQDPSLGYVLGHTDLIDTFSIIRIDSNLSGTLGNTFLDQGLFTVLKSIESQTFSSASSAVQNTLTGNSSYSAYHQSNVTSTGGNPYYNWSVTGGLNYSAGIDNANNDLFRFTNSSNLSSGQTLYTIDQYGNFNFYSGLNSSGTFTVNNIVSNFSEAFTIGPSYAEGTASASSGTVTGSSTTFSSGMVNGIIYWPSTTNIANITSYISSTSLTIDESFTQVSAPFIIFYGGMAYNPLTGFAFAPNVATNFYGDVGFGKTITVTGSTTLNGQVNVNNALYTNNLIEFLPTTSTIGTISQTGTAVTFSAGATSAFQGGYVIPSTGSPFYLVNYNGTSTMQASTSQTLSAGTTYTLTYFFNQKISLGTEHAQIKLFSDQKANLLFGLPSTNGMYGFYGSTLFSNGIGVGGVNRFTSGNPAASQSTTTVTTNGTFLSTDVGKCIFFSEGQVAFITAFTNSTTVTVTPSQTVSLQQYVLSYGIDSSGNGGFNNLYSKNLFMSDGALLSTSGGNNLTLTTTGSTNVTFPTNGTLATTSQIPSLPLSLSNGGTNANLTASAGAVTYSTPSAMAFSAVGSSGQLFQSTGITAPGWTTATYPSTATSSGTILRANGTNWVASTATFADTYSASSILYSNGSNAVTGLPTSNNGLLVTNGSGIPSIGTAIPTGVTMQGLPMTVISGTSQSAAVNNSYVSNNAGLVTITLPSTAAVGDVIQVAGLGAGGWKVGQNASQLIHIGSSVTTTGTGGSLASTNQYDSITYIRCVVTNTTWICYGVQGNITVV